MTAADARKTRRAEEAATMTTRIVDAACWAVVTLDPEEATAALIEAHASHAHRIRDIDRHIADVPDAFTIGSSDCPAAFDRWLRVLAKGGHTVVVPACITCGRADVALRHRAPQGRQCQSCSWKARTEKCLHCGQTKPVAKRADGPLCRTCYRKDAASQRICIRCRKRRAPEKRTEGGGHLCGPCARLVVCVRCQQTRQIGIKTPAGPLCRSCHEVPKRRCGICERDGEIAVRGKAGQPDQCHNCYARRRTGTCVACGQTRRGARLGGEAFHCSTCWPRTPRECANCGEITRPHANWPSGTICRPCYLRRVRNPRRCNQCDRIRVIVGDQLCGTCCGAAHLDFECQRCKRPGGLYADGLCSHCVGSDRARTLLTDGVSGDVPPQLIPLLQALTAVTGDSLVKWVSRSATAELLATVIARDTVISHDALDGLAQDNATRQLRQALVATAALPERVETIAQQQLWIADLVISLPEHQQRIMRPYAEWRVLRCARRKAQKDYGHGSVKHDRRKVRSALSFLDWIDDRKTSIGDVSQLDLDSWAAENPARRRDIADFIAWTSQHRLTAGLKIEREKRSLPSQFLAEHEQMTQLRRCLNDSSLPLDVRVVGAIVRLYGLPVSRIATLKVGQFERSGQHAYLRISEQPVLLPPAVTVLIENLIDSRAPSMIAPARAHGYLLAGRQPGRPRSQNSITRALARHGLRTLAARNTAMVEAAAHLPAAVMSELFGIHINTAEQWVKLAQTSWSAYLAAACT